jgi:predicted alpha/beta hydrolase family esterase
MKKPSLILAGIGDSGPGHWQTLWQQSDPAMQKLQHAEWDAPVLEEWLIELQRQLDRMGDDVVLVAHSLGALLVAHWALRSGGRVAGALLVSIPDPTSPAFPATAKRFGPVPSGALGFPTLIVCSQDDPYGTEQFMRGCAASWGSEVRTVGNLGHINATSSIGAWEQGRSMLRELGA